jgi:hypothetical protein
MQLADVDLAVVAFDAHENVPTLETPLRAARTDWAADPGLSEDSMTHRPNVERAIAQIATWRGRRIKLRYHGQARNHAWLKRRIAAVNLRTLLGRGLGRRDSAWVLAT